MSDHNITTNAGSGWNEDSELHPICGPDYETIEKVVFGCLEDRLSEEELEMLKSQIREECRHEAQQKLYAFLEELADWMYGDSPTKDGMACAGITFCWVFNPKLTPLTMSEVAGKFGLPKQAIGRFFSGEKDLPHRRIERVPFKERWPHIKTSHMQLK
jgi:hypothetical protein